MARRRNNSIICSSLAAAGLAAAGMAAFDGFGGTAHAEAIDLETAAVAPTYDVDGVHSGVVFSVRHAGVSNFHGRFNELKGSFTFDPSDPTSGSFTAEIPVGSVDTGNEKRDEHLKAADFFNARQFPVASFASTSVAATDTPGVFAVEGDLTLHGVTKPIEAHLHWVGTGSFRGKDVAGFDAKFSIKRSDFGITTYLAPDGGEGGGLGNTVDITIFVEGVKQ
jgi:polyisoprenoid-binding protein YceI